jgi:vancomycin resistance protein YoaR
MNVPGDPIQARRGGALPLGAGIFLSLIGAGALAAYAFTGRGATAQAATAPAVPAANDPGTGLRPQVRAAVDKLVAAEVALTFDGNSVKTTWKELGAVIDDDAVERAASRLARDGTKVSEDLFLDGKNGPAPVALDRAKTLAFVVGMKDTYDRPNTDARVDLDNRKVIPEIPGFGIDVYASLAVLAEAARAGQREVALAGGPTEPAVTVAKLGNLDITHVLGWFETKYPPGERDRNYNLKLVAEHVHGHIIMPGETFSFNEVVGDRTEKQGYRVAHVIQAGEMIDGLAGGACQISSTLHGASWFAGLEMINSRPHSRPSAYIPMALDATVVYPTTDLVMRNPYDFPVVLKYLVSQGTVRVEVLGRQRPWDKVAFEREIKKEIPYDTVTRDDVALPLGTQVVDQVGFPGYELVRKRVFYKDGKAVKTEKWDVKYPPTTEYVRLGTNPDPNLIPPKEKEPGGPMAPGGKIYRLER